MILSILSSSGCQVPVEVRLANTDEEVEKALRLRYQVFVEDERADLENDSHIEMDKFDQYCHHLIVKRLDTQEVIGTYRLLLGLKAIGGIGLYSEEEFDLAFFRPWLPYTVELGRSCVMPEWRGGRVISLLWEGIARYVLEHNVKYLVGCASISKSSLNNLDEIYSYLKQNYNFNNMIIKPRSLYKVENLKEVPLITEEKRLFRQLPPLIKGYLRAGAKICGEPAFDPVFNTIDFFLIFDRSKIVNKYKQNYLQVI